MEQILAGLADVQKTQLLILDRLTGVEENQLMFADRLGNLESHLMTMATTIKLINFNLGIICLRD